ncbi:uncharacterized protein [Miscanthus floridulus]|uniref:uncharacterized protein isoform X3 n=1 Tax=Miscanthus floridulus TaxID=154761 RepID=UPI00345993D5
MSESQPLTTFPCQENFFINKKRKSVSTGTREVLSIFSPQCFGFLCLIGYFRQAAGPKIGDEVVASQYQYNTEDIDEYSAERLRDAMSYAKDNAMLIQVSNVWIGSTGNVKLRGARFTGEGFSNERVRDDYKNLSWVLKQLISISGGDINKLPPDYSQFLFLLTKDNLTTEDEFLIVNNAALLPLKNRTEVFLMLHDRIVNYLGQKKRAKKKRILYNLPYKNDWLDTAMANAKINQWVVNVKNEYKRTTIGLLRLNRNVRSHLHEYGHDDDIEEILYCEWPMLLIAMEKQLHLEGELQDTDIENKFG